MIGGIAAVVMLVTFGCLGLNAFLKTGSLSEILKARRQDIVDEYIPQLNGWLCDPTVMLFLLSKRGKALLAADHEVMIIYGSWRKALMMVFLFPIFAFIAVYLIVIVENLVLGAF